VDLPMPSIEVLVLVDAVEGAPSGEGGEDEG
jgi:hypothetical protein